MNWVRLRKGDFMSAETVTEKTEGFIENQQSLKELFFTYEGRLNRKRYFLRGLVIGLVGAVLIYLMTVAAVSTENVLVAFADFVIYAIIAVSSFMLSIRRLHDMGKPGWWVLILFVPVVGVILSLVMLFKKGTEGPNEYGPDPLAGKE